jgi:hypothetical protein
MVVEKINKIIGKELIQKVDDTSISYRQLLYPYFANHFYYKLGINIIFGSKTDSKAIKLFLPSELMHSLDKLIINGTPLVSKKETLVQGNDIITKFYFGESIYFIALLLFVLTITNNKKVFKTYLFISGLLGLFLSLVGLYSLHKELLWNYNALLFNPLFLLIPFLKEQWYRKLIQICFVLIGIYLIILITKPHILLMVPFIITTIYFLWKLQKLENK